MVSGALQCGGGGIRTPGTLARTTVFETAPFDHSGTPPNGIQAHSNRAEKLAIQEVGLQPRTINLR